MPEVDRTVQQQQSLDSDKNTAVKPKKHTNWIVWIAGIAVVISIAVLIVNQHTTISNSQAELEKLHEEIAIKNIKNEELKEVAEAVEKDKFDDFDSYLEQRARMYGFTKDGEVVFINIAGN